MSTENPFGTRDERYGNGEALPLEVARARMPPIWVIYDHPKDFPAHFVVRVWYGLTPDPQVHVFDTLDAARAAVIQRGACANCRAECDEPVIAEVWL